MIWVACGVELLIADWTDFWILLSLQFINASVSFYEAARAGDAVAALKAALKPAAVAKRDGRWANISAAELVPGDLVTLAAGAAVPADCIINGGSIDVDQAALTGESLPVGMGAGDRPKMGSTVSRGEVEATVEYTGARTFFGKTAAMIQSVEQLSNIQRVLIRIMVFLLAISFVLCGVCLAYLLLRGCVAVRNANATMRCADATPPVVPMQRAVPAQHRVRGGAAGGVDSNRDGGGHHHHHGAGQPRAVRPQRHRVAAGGDRGAGGQEHAVQRQDGHIDAE